jgi:SMODS and SLOG-associating 2TM effector domain 1/Protein of unknown function (DUF4231)/SLOG in TRPM, prokaryote
VASDPDGSPDLDLPQPVVSPLRGIAATLDAPEPGDDEGAVDDTVEAGSELPEQPVVLVLGSPTGGETNALDHALDHALAQAVAQAAELAGAALIDGRASGSETESLATAARLAGSEPVVVVVAGGNVDAPGHVVDAAARGWTIVPVAGTGGLAAELAAGSEGGKSSRRRGRARSRATGDGPVTTILAHRVLPAVEPGHEMVKLVTWELHDVPVVKLTWRRLASYDVTAARLRRNSERLERSILLLGIIVTFIALLDNELSIHEIAGWWDEVFHWSLVVMPVVVSILIAMSASMAIGKRWVLLRSASESIRRELFGWRTRTGHYRDDGGGPTTRRASVERLVDRVCAIESRLMKSEVGTSTLVDVGEAPAITLAGAHHEDDGVSRLGPDAYFRLRIEHQLGYYRSKVRRLARNLRLLQVVSILAGAAGTILAVTGNEVWIGLSTAVAAAVVAHIGRSQIDATLSGYNYAIASLEELRSRWLAVPPKERTEQHFDDLVQRAERALEREQASWQRHMSDAMSLPYQE